MKTGNSTFPILFPKESANVSYWVSQAKWHQVISVLVRRASSSFSVSLLPMVSTRRDPRLSQAGTHLSYTHSVLQGWAFDVARDAHWNTWDQSGTRQAGRAPAELLP